MKTVICPSTVAQEQRKLVTSVLLFSSMGVTVGTMVVLLWKRGVLKAMLPQAVRTSVMRVTEKVARFTEPPAATLLDKTSSAYLTGVYAATARLFAVSFAGVALFFRVPYVPLPLSIAGSLVPAGVVILIPRTHVRPMLRKFMTLFSAFCVGYTMGPINWVALDTTVFVAVSVMATSAGFAVAAYITRGKVAFFVFSQVLSSSLALQGASIVASGMRQRRFGMTLSEVPKSDVLLVNINAVLTVQVVSNVLLAALHSLPTMIRLEQCATAAQADRHQQQNKQAPSSLCDEAEESRCCTATLDVDLEAFTLFSIAGYSLWTWFRYVWTASIRKILRGKRGTNLATTVIDAESVLMASEAAKRHDQLSMMSDIAASVTFLAFYVRIMAHLQNTASVGPALDRARYLFATVSPFVVGL